MQLFTRRESITLLQKNKDKNAHLLISFWYKCYSSHIVQSELAITEAANIS